MNTIHHLKANNQQAKDEQTNSMFQLRVGTPEIGKMGRANKGSSLQIKRQSP